MSYESCGGCDSEDSRPTLFGNPDHNPFALNPPLDAPPGATPLRDKVDQLTAQVMNYLMDLTGGVRRDLRPIVALAVEATYTRVGYSFVEPEEEPSPAAIRDRPDPTPADFRETIRNIHGEPEEYVRHWQVSKRTAQDGLSLLAWLPPTGEWEHTIDWTDRDQSGDTHHDHDGGTESAESNTNTGSDND